MLIFSVIAIGIMTLLGLQEVSLEMGKIVVPGETVTTTSSVIENIEARIASASDEEKQKLHSFLAKEGFNTSEAPLSEALFVCYSYLSIRKLDEQLNQSRAGRLAIATLAAAVASFQQLTFEDVRMSLAPESSVEDPANGDIEGAIEKV
uniref:Uncharacterized protein n=1 Tax=Pristionchus pacificus TaxID=54126 RepID=A0A454XI71_PRIPA|eukprot:PDM81931.1 hypothetical protein PRIPAC_34085 [Pristionchus pacificus]